MEQAVAAVEVLDHIANHTQTMQACSLGFPASRPYQSPAGVPSNIKTFLEMSTQTQPAKISRTSISGQQGKAIIEDKVLFLICIGAKQCLSSFASPVVREG